ncbi:hypothetical protein N7472_010191 [Penicillium cf. griseofulvum]|uniref:Uncharacterized protein n=1 Tax=Penicillium cf. griseofulvum TaxID=2972120 RepID=A0A9W9M0T8_9EURO|nr:hypothetical protein N7472_010191 [Penicillium cf. griseofulvum]
MVDNVNYEYHTNRTVAIPLLPPLFATTTALPPLLFSSLTIFLHYHLPHTNLLPYKKRNRI